MTIISWPAALKARVWDPHLRNQAASGGTSATGRTQRVFGDAGFWEVKVSQIVVHDRASVAAYRALIARLRAGEDILLPVRDLVLASGARNRFAFARLSADAPLRATQIDLSARGVDIAAGHHLAIDGRLHLVTEIVSGPSEPPLLNPALDDQPLSEGQPWADAVAGTASYSVRILPPLRSDIAAGSYLALHGFTLRCVLQDPGEGDLDLDLGRFARPSLSFSESV